MTRKMLYKVKNDDGSETVSLTRPPDGVSYEIRWRLLADEGMAITNGPQTVTVIDLVHRKDCEAWSDCGLPWYLKPPSLEPSEPFPSSAEPESESSSPESESSSEQSSEPSSEPSSESADLQ